MRSENSVRNSLWAIAGQAVTLIFGFVTRIAFVRILGEAYLGVNGVLWSVLSLLSLTELGIGAALTFSLYRPIAEHDREKIGQLMNLFAFTYRIVAALVMIIGLALIPFLPLIMRDVPEIGGLTVIYLLFLINSSASYLFSYKRALITAAELDYKNQINLSLFSIIQNSVQLLLLLFTGSYVLYLAAQLVCTLASNIAISRTASKLFPDISGVKGIPDRESLVPIVKNVKAMFLTRFGSVAVTGTDNLLIASVNVILVGLYSNYLMILQTVQTVLLQVVNAVTASVGNLIALGGDNRKTVYRNIVFAVSWLYGFCAIALDLLMGRFITVAFGAGLEIPEAAVHIMALNFLIAGMRQPNMMYINAAGLFEHVKWRGVVEAAVNLGVSALFLSLDMGLFGVLLGTLVSHLSVGVWWEAVCVSKHCVSGGGGLYAKDSLVYISVIAAGWLASGAVCRLMPDSVPGFIGAAAVVLVIPNLLMMALFSKTERFKFFTELAVRMSGKIKSKKMK